ncbi:MAG: HlyD family efflux transporter periplasmic adaptor subunit [Planctomycetes bacterium]|nr:HlyD family efflux transporter periplasmic adaptor subunit [Planctomycetota bacterium]
MKRLIKWVIVLAVLAGIGWGAYAAWARYNKTEPIVYRTATVERGNVLSSISATGTIEPEEVIDVGAQVAGRIDAFGKDDKGDTIDYGSVVRKGTVLAQIDDSLYSADAAAAKAQFAAAKAGVAVAQANVEQMKAKLSQAQSDWTRAQKLGPSEALAQASYDAYKAAYETAAANVTVANANVLQAEAAVEQAQASVDRTQRNLGYCTITSPVEGVIIDRRVNIGQTVVSSLSAPSLFLLAKDLHKMQVWVAVNEADIGNIHAGQPVTFTVDTFGGRTFKGSVGKVRLNASMTSNVVTYTVEVETDNADGTLMPYMTANVTFEIARANDVLIVPNAALNWTPQEDQISPQHRAKPRTESAGASDGGGSAQHAHHGDHGGGASSHRRLWVRDGEGVRPMVVTTGLTDGATTAVSGDDLAEGMAVIVGEQRPGGGSAGGATNPFAPQFGRSRRSSN